MEGLIRRFAGEGIMGLGGFLGELVLEGFRQCVKYLKSLEVL